jgi:hypothetical protein
MIQRTQEVFGRTLSTRLYLDCAVPLGALDLAAVEVAADAPAVATLVYACIAAVNTSDILLLSAFADTLVSIQPSCKVIFTLVVPSKPVFIFTAIGRE